MLLPPGHKLLITDDGTPTLISERFDEACHSTSGAREETQVHYLRGCHVEELLHTQNQVNILEVGFGTGLGWRETQKLAQQYPQSQLQFVSLELDEALVAWACPEAQRRVIDEHISYHLQQANASLTVLVGDARSELPYWSTQLVKFHAIYQDAFSPRKNPTLWSKQWFELLGRLALNGAYLSTYSASISIRKALVEAGWGVYAGEQFARKKTSTRARWQYPSDEALIAELSRHPTPALTDSENL